MLSVKRIRRNPASGGQAAIVMANARARALARATARINVKIQILNEDSQNVAWKTAKNDGMFEKQRYH